MSVLARRCTSFMKKLIYVVFLNIGILLFLISLMNLASSIFLFLQAPPIKIALPSNFINKDKWVVQSNWKIIEGVLKGENTSGIALSEKTNKPWKTLHNVAQGL